MVEEREREKKKQLFVEWCGAAGGDGRLVGPGAAARTPAASSVSLVAAYLLLLMFG